MQTLTISLPDAMSVPSDWDAKMFFAAKLFEDGILSSGQAADVVGISKREFLETVGDYGVSVFGETADDVLAELRS